MKAWHIAAIAVGVGAAFYLYRSTGGPFANGIVSSTPYVPPSKGPAIETRTGVGHFGGVMPVVAAGPDVEGRTGRSHF